MTRQSTLPRAHFITRAVIATAERDRLAADLEEARARAAQHRREAARLNAEAVDAPSWRTASLHAEATKHIERARDQEQIAAGLEDELGGAS